MLNSIEKSVQNEDGFLTNGHHFAQGGTGLLQLPGVGLPFCPKGL